MPTEENILKKLEEATFKAKFIEGLNKFGFPLEFIIRKKLKDRGYNPVQEGFFTDIKNNEEITKTFDISAYKNKKQIMHKNLTINLDLYIVGDCKFSSDISKFLFAVQDKNNPKNKLFIGPILTSLQSAIYGRYHNSDVVSNFLSKFGDIMIASNIIDSSEEHIINGNEKEDTKRKTKTPEYERIFNIVEDQILPAILSNFRKFRTFSYQDYASQISNLKKEMPINYLIDCLEGQYFSAKLIIPLIVTSKPILYSLTNEKEEIIDIKEVPFIIYEHSVLNPNYYTEILDNFYDVGIFICNDKYFDDCINYIENIFDKIFAEIIKNLEKYPNKLIDDFEEIQRLTANGIMLLGQNKKLI